MKYLIEHSVFPIIAGQDCVGQGFVADGFFITAAHVILKNHGCFIELQDKRIKLSDITPIYMGQGDIEKNPNLEDVAIYDIGHMVSFLHLSTRKPKETDLLKTIHIALNYDNKTNHFYKDLIVWKATYTGQEEGNYLYCKCYSYEGCSGSPLVSGDKVIGIVHGGNEEGLCAFLKPSSFMYPDGTYNASLIRALGNQPKPDEPFTPEYFNRKALEQISDAFE